MVEKQKVLEALSVSALVLYFASVIAGRIVISLGILVFMFLLLKYVEWREKRDGFHEAIERQLAGDYRCCDELGNDWPWHDRDGS